MNSFCNLGNWSMMRSRIEGIRNTYHREVVEGNVNYKDIKSPNCQFNVGGPLFMYQVAAFTFHRYLKKLMVLEKKHNQNNFKINQKPIVFCCYANQDEKYFKEIQAHFSVTKDTINLWDSNKIRPGEHRKNAIEKALENTKIAIFLLSSNFFASKIIINEVNYLLKEAATKSVIILLVLVRPCNFTANQELSQYQPMNHKFLVEMNDGEKNRLYVELVKEVTNRVREYTEPNKE